MDGVWERLGRLLRTFGCLLIVFVGVLSRAFCKHKSKIGLKRPFGSISGRFWKGLGDLGWILAGFWERFGSNSGGGGRCLREAVSIENERNLNQNVR